jgi:hypothetical protein
VEAGDVTPCHTMSHHRCHCTTRHPTSLLMTTAHQITLPRLLLAYRRPQKRLPHVVVGIASPCSGVGCFSLFAQKHVRSRKLNGFGFSKSVGLVLPLPHTQGKRWGDFTGQWTLPGSTGKRPHHLRPPKWEPISSLLECGHGRLPMWGLDNGCCRACTCSRSRMRSFACTFACTCTRLHNVLSLARALTWLQEQHVDRSELRMLSISFNILQHPFNILQHPFNFIRQAA